MYCPNPQCPGLLSTGDPAEFREGVKTCAECGTWLLAGEPPRIEDKPSTPPPRPRKVRESLGDQRPLLITLGMYMSFATAIFVLFLLLLTVFLSGLTDTHTVSGEPVTRGALLMYVVPTILAIASACFLLAYAFWREHAWSRDLVILMNISPMILLVVQGELLAALVTGLSESPWLLFTVWYFHGKKNVVAYYRHLESKSKLLGDGI